MGPGSQHVARVLIDQHRRKHRATPYKKPSESERNVAPERHVFVLFCYSTTATAQILTQTGRFGDSGGIWSAV